MPKYHIALSFAGEDRAYVEQVATVLKAEGVDVFYDRFEEADLWGKDLYTHLSKVYQKMALFTVIFVSDAYSTKLWTNHERRSAQARAFSDSKEYILPALFDDTIEVPGLLKTTGHVSLKTKTPGQLASLVIQKLKKSGVILTQQFAYSENARADVDFPLSKGKVVSKIVRALKSYTWGTQNPAVVQMLELDWTKIKPDEAFVLGRNLYQTACGGERKAASILASLRRELAGLPEERAFDLLNGMFFEVYFNSAGEFRGRKLKSRFLSQLFELQAVKKYAPCITFITRALDPYRTSLLFLPDTEPDKVIVGLSYRRTDPPTVKALTVNGRDLLTVNPDEEELSSRIWRLSYQNFTVEELTAQLSDEWGVPLTQMEITCSPALEENVKLRLPEGASIVSPVRS